MKTMSLSALEDNLWDIIGAQSEPTFLFLDDRPLMQGAFLRTVAYGHPYFGKARFYCVGSGYQSLAHRLAPLEKAGLIHFEILEEEPKNLKDVIVFSSSPSHPAYDVSIRIEGEGDENIQDEDYQGVWECLSLYGKPLEQFALPKPLSMDAHPRDWHYLGPSKDLRAYDAIQDELRLALSRNEGELCPIESFSTILDALKGENVDPKQLYHALRSCYEYPCLLRDMASFQHDTWCLRTLCFHASPESKASMCVSYPMLLMKELPKYRDKSDEESFPIDILYSDFLVPLWYLRKLVR